MRSLQGKRMSLELRPESMVGLGELTAVILAGGLGTRLRSVVGDRPKVLAEVSGRPFLSYLLDRLAEAGIRDAVLCTGYQGDQVRAAFGEVYAGIRLRYSQEVVPRDTGGALRLALPLLGPDPIVVLNGDSFCDGDLAAVWGWHCRKGAAGTLVLVEVANVSRFGGVDLDEDGRVVRFQEKGREGSHGWINAGTYVLNPPLLVEIPPDRPCSLERDLFPAWIGRGLYGYRHHGQFLDIGVPEALETAAAFLAGIEGAAVGPRAAGT